MEPVVFETKDPTNISIQLRHQEGDPPPSVDGFSKPLLLIVGGYPLVNQHSYGTLEPCHFLKGKPLVDGHFP
jgi:hypothetical protein